ncbi:MAG: uroporphyrinogen decarboxylase, partial [Geminicoccaceae bacterium]|nr:uroporphyrinogen decarboxylase [Geminicoccaceae bacterium]
MIRNDRFLRALRRETVDRTPVWLMRQAGRYLPEYRALRARAGSFLAMVRDPELACEITLQPLRRFPLDAAILFSDILVIPEALGLGLDFVEGEGPRLSRPLSSRAEIEALPALDPAALDYVAAAARAVRAALGDELPLIGFAGSPLTLACYMVEGGASADFARVRALAHADPEGFAALLAKLADAVAACLRL